MECSCMRTASGSVRTRDLQLNCPTLSRSAASTACRPFSRASRCAGPVISSRLQQSRVHPGRSPATMGSGLAGALRPRTGVHTAGRRKVTTCAFLGVGAPEAVLVGVVALIVFGPKGLAEAVKSLGSTLKAFQPTIREIVSVSSDLKNTLEEQIGLDDIRSEIRNSVVPEPRPRPLPEKAESTSEEAALGTTAGELASEMEEDLERKRAAATAAAWGGQPPVQPIAREDTSQYDGEGSQATAESTKPPLNELSLADLEAELARRKAADKARETL